MTQLKTQPTNASVAGFLGDTIPEKRRPALLQLDRLFQDASGFAPKMWGDSIVGYGSYRYTYASGRTGVFLATGFAPRARAISIYIMPGYADYSNILDRLGPHKTGKSCLYISALDDIHQTVLATLIRTGLRDLNARWPVSAT